MNLQIAGAMKIKHKICKTGLSLAKAEVMNTVEVNEYLGFLKGFLMKKNFITSYLIFLIMMEHNDLGKTLASEGVLGLSMF